MKRKKQRNVHGSSLVKKWREKWINCKKTHPESGATFMEVLVTIAIIAILMTAIGIAVVPFIFKAQVTTARSDINTIDLAVTSYFTQNFEYPDESEWKAAISPLIGKGEIPPDPWGNEYIYLKPGPNDTPYGVYSSGEDGIPDTDDDIKSWEK